MSEQEHTGQRRLAQHPTVRRMAELARTTPDPVLSAARLRELCLAAGADDADVIGAYLDDRRTHLDDIVRPLQHKAETVYVLPGSAAHEHVTRRFPNKTPKAVTNGFPDEVNILLDQIGPRPRRTPEA